jgi:hypothetical protein
MLHACHDLVAGNMQRAIAPMVLVCCLSGQQGIAMGKEVLSQLSSVGDVLHPQALFRYMHPGRGAWHGRGIEI